VERWVCETLVAFEGVNLIDGMKFSSTDFLPTSMPPGLAIFMEYGVRRIIEVGCYWSFVSSVEPIVTTFSMSSIVIFGIIPKWGQIYAWI
jgi:hypothetical protein